MGADAKEGTDIVIHESGTQTWFMSNTNANGQGGNDKPPTDPDGLTPAQKANELTLAFAEPTDSFELVFAFGVPKFSPTGVSLAPWTGGAVGHMGHTVLFDGVTKYPPCPCPHGPDCDAPCWDSGWRNHGDSSGSHMCPPPKPVCRHPSDPFPCAGDECTSSACCMGIMCMTGSWGQGEFTKGSGPEHGGQHEHPPAHDPLFYSINASRNDGRALMPLSLALTLTLTLTHSREEP